MNIQANHAVTFFDLGDDAIRVESSFLTGQEQVFLNDQLISKKLSWRYSSVHQFELKGKAIEIRIRIGSILRGPVVIELWVNGVMADKDEWDLQRIMQQTKWLRSSKDWWKVLLVIFLCGLAGAVAGYSVATLLVG